MWYVGKGNLRSGNRIVGKLHDLQEIIFARVMLFQKAFDVGVHCGINSYVTTITYPLMM